MTVCWLTRICRSSFASLPGSRSPERIASTMTRTVPPGDEICRMRSLWRHRENLIQLPTIHVQHYAKGAGPSDNHNLLDRIVRLHMLLESPQPPGALSASLAAWAEIRLRSHACTPLLKCQISVPREPSLLQPPPVDSSAVQMFLVNAEGDSHNRQFRPQRQ